MPTGLTPSQIREYAINSADCLLQYSHQNNTAAIKYSVRQIENDGFYYRLYLDTVITSTEGLRLQINGVLFEETKFKICESDAKTRSVTIVCLHEDEAILNDMRPDNTFLVYDLRFLIERVRTWYQNYGHLLSLPQNAPDVPITLQSVLSGSPSEEQIAAIRGALTAPLSYIWGAPGTGKTQFVLSHCLLNYLSVHKKVLVVAPTNRAVEQVLFGILPNLEAAGISQERILRLGIPSKEFAQQYPKVCEDHTLTEKLKELEVLLEDAASQQKHCKQQIRNYEKFQAFLTARKQFHFHSDNVCTQRDLLYDLLTKEKEQKRDFEFSSASVRQCERSLSAEADALRQNDEKAGVAKRQLSRYKSKFSKCLFAAKIQRLKTELLQALAEIEHCKSEKEQLSARLAQEQDACTQARQQWQKTEAEIKNAYSSINDACAFFKSIHLLPPYFTYTTSDHKDRAIHQAIEDGQQLFQEKEAKYEGFEEINLETLKSKEQSIAQKIADYKKAADECKKKHQTHINQCQIIACTIDCCLAKVEPDGDFVPAHIFLDEAGYSSLIKAAALTVYGCPLTLLGDHMQLPPVCEINDTKLKQEEYYSAVFWAQSALYLEDLFTSDFENLQTRYFDHFMPSFSLMPKHDLTQSFRFGASLASILAGEVYSKKLQGSASHETKISYISIPRHSVQKRTNQAECDAIREFVLQHPTLEIGIITPYVNQKNLLKKAISGLAEVNTVHGAQGREWDCVILSVVDTTDKWFTDSRSRISDGKKVINTAISRAKKQLIIVCDGDYWKTQDQQLIGKLLSVGEEIPK